jgi:L-rhamnose isomerase/sugar isomerase
MSAQELWLKSALLDREKLAGLQAGCDLVGAEELFRGEFYRDVRPLLSAWREQRGLAIDPLCALRHGGYVEKITRERSGRQSAGGSYA